MSPSKIGHLIHRFSREIQGLAVVAERLRWWLRVEHVAARAVNTLGHGHALLNLPAGRLKYILAFLNGGLLRLRSRFLVALLLLHLVVIVRNIVNMNFRVLAILTRNFIALSRFMQLRSFLGIRFHSDGSSYWGLLDDRSWPILLSGDGASRALHERAVRVGHAGGGRHCNLTVEMGLWLEGNLLALAAVFFHSVTLHLTLLNNLNRLFRLDLLVV